MRRLVGLLLLILPWAHHAQVLDPDYLYSKEFVWGFNKNTSGGSIGGLAFKWSRILDDNVYHVFGFELSNVKHPKENRVISGQTGQGFIIGKSNYLYTLRLQYGRERILFHKDTQQGVQINAGVMGGPTIGFHAPYYIQTIDGEFEKYDPDIHGANGAAGPGRLFQGLGQSETLIGVNVKSSVSFEFGAFKNNVAGLELGLMLEAFGREVVLMPTEENRAIFTSAFITLYWGKRK
jgi:hypothetical protein